MTQRVQILEDQPFQRGYLANLFGSRGGVQVDACEDVEAAIALCACHSYDLVVSDLLMPGQDGIQFIQALAAQPRPPTPCSGQHGIPADDGFGTPDGRVAGAGGARRGIQAGHGDRRRNPV